MSLHTALAVAAFAASIILFLAHASRGLVVVALVASGLEVLMAFGLLALHVSASVPLQLVLGALIAIPAVLISAPRQHEDGGLRRGRADARRAAAGVVVPVQVTVGAAR